MAKHYYFSLFDYAVRELEYSDGGAWRRIKAMRLCTDNTLSAGERLEDGTLSLSAAAQLQNTFERWDRDAAPGADHTAVHAAAGVPAGGVAPIPDAASAAGRKPGLPLNPAAREELVKRAAARALARLGGGRWELKVVIDAECQRGLEELKGLLSHVDPHMTAGQLVGRLVRDGLHRYDPARPRHARRNTGRASSESARPDSYCTPAALEPGKSVPSGGTSPAKSAERRGQPAKG